MIAWKLFRQMKDGSIAPLFINKRLRLTPGVWYGAECHPTKGFKVRPGWHVCGSPNAPHLSMKGRVWRRVEIDNFTYEERPMSQGGIWFVAMRMRVLAPE